VAIEFMVLGAPRSGTAWCANWLSTDATLCIHEPLARYKLTELNSLHSFKTLGIACTVLGQNPGFVNKHTARKLILHRDPKEVRESMQKLGISGDYDFEALNAIRGMHCHWRKVFMEPALIYEYLLERPFDAERHAELIGLNIQNVDLIQRLQRLQLASAYG
jgi:hypothetical protein